ncbi:SusC/RagA family TonB-linked outer membrane protein [Chitinophaga rhizosphaerae]|uniref:SusC/RagA family TonB-linked outer membrane protein n=1 Tax=Chitinophaga rhizosphaerae TaxID=1864947 RepID=UPI0013E00095|nr:SusC/RagA family TonB-linked outer membrane protein [Chitinophaga rhizosphaerae]
MKKLIRTCGLPYRPAITQCIKVMKITFLLLIACLQLQAGFSQKRITVRFDQASLKEALRQIELRTSLRFIYNDDLLPAGKTVSLSLQNAKVEDVLSAVLDGTSLRWSIQSSGMVVISPDPGETARFLVVRGTVRDTAGAPLPGAIIRQKDGPAGTTASETGAFELNVPEGTVLIFSLIGYETRELPASAAPMDVQLKITTSALEQVVVVGYGSDTRRKLVTSVSTIKTDKMASLPFNNLADALAGRAPGVLTMSSGGEPGVGSARVAIRGGSGPDRGGPLYVIDNIVSSRFDFENLQPQDIENISILKDGGATAVYGARGANGIILVTTKRGRAGKVNINFGVLTEFARPTVLPKRVNAYNYALAQNAAAAADNQPAVYSPGRLDTILNRKDPWVWQDNDWYDMTLRNYTPQTKYSLDVSGGSEKTTYFFSLAYFNQHSNYKTDVTGFKRYNARASITQHFDKQGLTAGANMYATITNNRFPGASAYEIWSHLQNSPPLKLGYNENGTYAAGVDHPLVDIDGRSGYRRDEYRNVNGNLTLDWQVPWVKGLKAGLLGYYKIEDRFRKGWFTRAPQFDNLGIEQYRTPPSLEEIVDRYQATTLQARIEYQQRFRKHSVNVLALYEESEEKSEQLAAKRINFPSSAVDQLFAGSNIGLTNGGVAGEGGRRGYVGRVKYDYDARYIIEGSFRYDGSDRFPRERNSKWGFFPSLSIGWAANEETFFPFKNIFDQFKLRYTMATVGNDDVRDPSGNSVRFPYLLNSYSLIENAYVVGGNPMTGFREGSLVDRFVLSWYSTRDYNTGLDFALLRNRLSGTVEYFYKRTTGYIINSAARYTTPLGTSLPYASSGSAFRRHGMELQLNYADRAGKDFNYSIGGNLTMYNELWERNDSEDSISLKNPLRRQTHATFVWGTGLHNLGYYQTVDDIINNPRYTPGGQLTPGDIRYQDTNGDGKIDGNDATRIGKQRFPALTYGVNLAASYKAFSIEMLWQGTGTRTVRLQGSLTAYTATNLVYDFQRDFWTPGNRDARFPRQSLSSDRNGNNNYAPGGTSSDFWLMDARYLRLKSLRIAFDAKKQFPRQLGFLNSCLLTLNGTNLLTFSPVTDFFDPETSDESNYGYPVQKVYSVGLNIGF